MQDRIQLRYAAASLLFLAFLVACGEDDGGESPPGPLSEPAVGAGADRVRVTSDSLFAPNFRVRWPTGVDRGDVRIFIEGLTRRPDFLAAVVREEATVGSTVVAEPAALGEWRPFRAMIPVTGGVREGDVVVFSTGPGEGDRELVFQLIRD